MKTLLRSIYNALFILLVINTLAAQTNIDSLKNTLHNLDAVEKVELLNDITIFYLESEEHYNIDSSLKYSKLAIKYSGKIKNKYYKAHALRNLGFAKYYLQEYDSSLFYFNESFNAIGTLDSLKLKAELFNLIGVCYYYKGEFDTTLKNWNNELELNYIIGDKSNIATNLNNLGIVYKNMDKYDEAIHHYQEALKIVEDGKDSLAIARALNNIGNIYFHNRKNYKQAFDYYTKALDIYLVQGNKEKQAVLYNNIGLIYFNQQKYQNALNHFNEALKIYSELNKGDGIAETQNFLAILYAKLGNFEKAEENIQRSYNYYTSNNEKPRIAETIKDQGDIYLEWKKYQKALNAYYESYELSVELGRKGDIVNIYYKLSDTYAKLNNYQKAYEYHKQYSELNDSLFSERVNRQIAEFQTLYETEKKDKEISLLNKDKALQDATLKRQKLVIWFFTIGFGIISILLILILRLFRQKQKANKILEQKNEEISLQRDHIFQQNKEITDSIEYASRIQNALLPPKELIEKIIPDSFVLFKPRDIVSGDFYWLSQKENKIISVTADCTGHGVPGAFMSMLGISFLNEIVNLTNVDDLTADVILNDMRSLVISSLRQTGNIGESRDGMDLTLCIIDYDAMELNYAGAYNPLFIIRNGELLETKADKMPIGIHLKKIENFTNHIIPIKKGDLIYTFSDGYVDQFGGPDNSKFRKKNFIQLLLEIHQEDMPKQKEILEQKLQEWMEGYEQVDDILVSGIRI